MWLVNFTWGKLVIDDNRVVKTMTVISINCLLHNPYHLIDQVIQ